MVMVPGDTIWGGEPYHKFLRLFKESVNEGLIGKDRIDDAVRRILKVKHQLFYLYHYLNKKKQKTIMLILKFFFY